MRAEAKVDRLFNALGDPTRRAIVRRLGRGPQSVSRLAEPLEITVTAVAQHIAVLEQCGLVRTEKIGRVRTCELHAAGLDVLQTWIDGQRSLWERRFDRLGDLLSEDD